MKRLADVASVDTQIAENVKFLAIDGDEIYQVKSTEARKATAVISMDTASLPGAGGWINYVRRDTQGRITQIYGTQW